MPRIRTFVFFAICSAFFLFDVYINDSKVLRITCRHVFIALPSVSWFQFQQQQQETKVVQVRATDETLDVADTDDCRLNLESLFIHIPRTAGTAIEDTLRDANVMVGRFRVKENRLQGKPLLDWETDHYACSTWHRPPKIFVQNSFTVVRDVFERVVSEICYTQKLYSSHKQSKYKRLEKIDENSCHGMNRMVFKEFATKKVKLIEYCHFWPQVWYARYAQFVYNKDQLENLWHCLKRVYDLDENITLRHIQPRDQGSKNAFFCNFNASCLNEKSRSLIQEYYREDIEFINGL